MSSAVATGFIIMWVVYIVVGLVIYHKIFEVVYFDFGKAMLKEVGGAMAFATIMAFLSVYLWWLAAIALVIVGILMANKNGNKAFIIIFVVLAIIVAIIGIVLKGAMNSSKEDSSESGLRNSVESTMMI